MFQWIRKNAARWFLFLFLFSFFLECVPEKAEASRRGGRSFGRRVSRNGVQRRARVARGRGRRNGRIARGQRRRQAQGRNFQVAQNNNNNNNNNSDIFGLDEEPTTGINSNRDLQRLSQFSNIATNRNGQLFELNNGDLNNPRQPLVLFNGQVVRGAFGGMQSDTISQVQELNETGNFRVLR